MDTFLLIHTSLDNGFAALAGEDEIIDAEKSSDPKQHGAFLHQAIAGLLKRNRIKSSDISAIGVTSGPGSYTGIRVGLSAAKGLGYAWRKPLVLCSNLRMLAAVAVEGMYDKDAVYVPLIHARQNEYYTGFYNSSYEEIRPDLLMVFDEKMQEFPADKRNLFFGIDLQKFTAVTGIVPSFKIENIDINIFGKVIYRLYTEKKITDAEDAVPAYLKDVYIASGHV